jgi:hypothetical protein
MLCSKVMVEGRPGEGDVHVGASDQEGHAKVDDVAADPLNVSSQSTSQGLQDGAKVQE